MKIAYSEESIGQFNDPLLSLDKIMHYSGHNIGNFSSWDVVHRLTEEAELVFLKFGDNKKDISLNLDFDDNSCGKFFK